MTIRAIFFDIGGIFFNESDRAPVKAWEKRLDLQAGQLVEIVLDNSIAKQATLGNATVEEIWNEVAKQLSLSKSEIQQLKIDMWSGWIWDTNLLSDIRILKSNYKLGTISDAWPGAREGMIEYINNGIFDVSVFSYEEGLEKPDPQIFHRALSRLEVIPQEAIFLDDKLKNIQGAQAIGMAGVHVIDPKKQVREIINILSKGGSVREY